jgi:hypothetical protein
VKVNRSSTDTVEDRFTYTSTYLISFNLDTRVPKIGNRFCFKELICLLLRDLRGRITSHNTALFLGGILPTSYKSKGRDKENTYRWVSV